MIKGMFKAIVMGTTVFGATQVYAADNGAVENPGLQFPEAEVAAVLCSELPWDQTVPAQSPSIGGVPCIEDVVAEEEVLEEELIPEETVVAADTPVYRPAAQVAKKPKITFGVWSVGVFR